MKSRTIVIKRKYLIFILILSIVLLFFLLICKREEDVLITNSTLNISKKEIIEENEIKTVSASKYKKIEAYTNIPKQLHGYEVVGRLQIPKIALDTYILSETNRNTLNVSVTKLCGPKVNGVGNFCITGHNYINDKMFSKLKKIENNDKILVTDIYDNEVEYVVYDTYKVKPDEVECLSQETDGEREITLITCTTGAIKRLIVKAIEVYD